MAILVFDPGESTGWVCEVDKPALSKLRVVGGTIKHDRVAIWELLKEAHPAVIVFETFKLYPDKAQALSWDKFYTCEIIGIIKLYLEMNPIVKFIEQGASIKKYSGAKTTDEHWLEIKELGETVTEHTFDAYMHYCYYKRFNK